MKKNEFITELKNRLSGLPDEDITRTIDYYKEIIEDYIEDGTEEEKAVAAVGSIEQIVAHTLAETPMPKLVKARIKPNRALKVWEIILIILGFPLWLPILAAIFVILFSVYAVIWSAVLCLYSVAITLFAVFISGIFNSAVFMFTGQIAQAVVTVGIGLTCGGFTVFAFMGCNQVTKGLIWLSKKIWIGIKSCFIGKGSAR